MKPTHRDWSTGDRAMWWLKFTGAVAAFVISVAGAAKILGVSVDVQSKSESRAQYESLRQELRSDQDRAMARLEDKIDKVSERIDLAMTALSRKRKE